MLGTTTLTSKRSMLYETCRSLHARWGGGGGLHMCLLCTLSIDIDQDIAVSVKLKELSAWDDCKVQSE